MPVTRHQRLQTGQALTDAWNPDPIPRGPRPIDGLQGPALPNGWVEIQVGHRRQSWRYSKNGTPNVGGVNGHPALLGKSAYFDSCFGNPLARWVEYNRGWVWLKDEDPAVFAYIDEWITTQTINAPNMLLNNPQASPSALMYCKIWKLADYLTMKPLMNFVMTRLYFGLIQIRNLRPEHWYGLVEECYGKGEKLTPPGCPLRKGIMALFASGGGDLPARNLTAKQRAALARALRCKDFYTDVFVERPWVNYVPFNVQRPMAGMLLNDFLV